MKIIRPQEFKAQHAWGAMDICLIERASVRLHWTDKPYRWHINDGEEVFAVMHGKVEMRFRQQGQESAVVLNAGDIFFASSGTEHVAHPMGEARILVVEKEGSV